MLFNVEEGGGNGGVREGSFPKEVSQVKAKRDSVN